MSVKAIDDRMLLLHEFLQEQESDHPRVLELKRFIRDEFGDRLGHPQFSGGTYLRTLLTWNESDEARELALFKGWARAFIVSETSLLSVLRFPHRAGGIRISRVLLTVTAKKAELREIYYAILHGKDHRLIPVELRGELRNCAQCREVTSNFIREYFMSPGEFEQDKALYIRERELTAERKANFRRWDWFNNMLEERRY